MEDVNDKVDAFFSRKDNLELILRGVQFVLAVISFLCSTAVTGLKSGDYAFITTYTVWVYTLLYIIFVLRQKKVELIPLHKLAIDGVFTLLLLIAGIAVAASGAFTICNLFGTCGAAYACVVFLFVGAGTQGASVYITYTQEYRTDVDDHIDSPDAMLEGP
ncbi:Aste57867_17168 [Aphanomyces stellatus]|uniref:Aste57867_17168 protein n=1 Tax=Aphanomyces stellatus TaxID=120398 RepID=A0A485L820_9STRA|nr:hypothetical protein As57867_017109 [Aphanomyces stellatus]VFT93925.1 Aste57867_17168 [Aphanomyces stellatus]